jgi:hypothetical protein
MVLNVELKAMLVMAAPRGTLSTILTFIWPDELCVSSIRILPSCKYKYNNNRWIRSSQQQKALTESLSKCMCTFVENGEQKAKAHDEALPPNYNNYNNDY